MAKKFIFYDTETTGVNVEKDRIVEIAAYDPSQDSVFKSYVKPDIPIPSEATAIHGISNETVSAAPSFKEIFSEFCKFCGEDSILVAHNNDNFDAPLMINECRRHLLDELHLPTIDSLKWVRKYRPDLPRHNLQYLRQLYGIEANNAHRALDDVMVLHKLFMIMVDDLTPSTVLTLMLKEEEGPFKMSFGKYRGKTVDEIPQSYFTWLSEQGALDKPENEKLRKALENRIVKEC